MEDTEHGPDVKECFTETSSKNKPFGEDDEAEGVTNKSKCGDNGGQDTDNPPSEQKPCYDFLKN